MNSWLISATASHVVSSLALILSYAYLYARYREPCLRWWLWAWIFYTLRFGFFLGGMLLNQSGFFIMAEQLSVLASASALCHGSLLMAGKRPWKGWPLAGLPIATWIVLAALWALPRSAVALPVYLYAGLLQIVAGVLFLRLPRPRSFGASLSGWALVVWGVHRFDYPYLRFVSWFAPWGFIIGSVFGLLVALGLLLWYLELVQGRMAASERRYRELFESAPVGIMLYTHDKGVTEGNAKAAELLGYDREGLKGITPKDVILAEDRERTPTKAVPGGFSPGESRRLDRQYLRKDGGVFTADVYLVRPGEEDNLLVIFQDVTGQRHIEERFRTLTANIPGAVYRCANDTNWTMEYLSDGIEAITGYPASDFLGNAARSFASLIHPEDREHVYSAVQRAVSAKHPYAVEFMLLDKSGGAHWIHGTGRGVFDTNGSLLWLDGVILDATERKNAENSLRKTLAFNQMILRHTPVGISVYDGETGQCIMANDVLANILGDRLEQMMARNFRKIDSWREAGLDIMAEEALAGLGTRRKDVRFRSASGRDVFLDCMFARFDVDGRPYLLRVASDISDRLRMEEIMIQTEKMMSVGGLAAGMAHEINNPLGGILQTAQVVIKRLTSDSPPNQGRRHRSRLHP